MIRKIAFIISFLIISNSEALLLEKGQKVLIRHRGSYLDCALTHEYETIELTDAFFKGKWEGDDKVYIIPRDKIVYIGLKDE